MRPYNSSLLFSISSALLTFCRLFLFPNVPDDIMFCEVACGPLALSTWGVQELDQTSRRPRPQHSQSPIRSRQQRLNCLHRFTAIAMLAKIHPCSAEPDRIRLVSFGFRRMPKTLHMHAQRMITFILMPLTYLLLSLQ